MRKGSDAAQFEKYIRKIRNWDWRRHTRAALADLRKNPPLESGERLGLARVLHVKQLPRDPLSRALFLRALSWVARENGMFLPGQDPAEKQVHVAVLVPPVRSDGGKDASPGL